MSDGMIRRAHKVVPLPTLVFHDAPLADQIIQLLDQGTLGRSRFNTYVLPHPQVSRRHASIQRQSDAFVVMDLGSRSGTSVNGVLLDDPQALHHGDIIAFGPVRATFTQPPSIAADETLLFELEQDPRTH